MSMIKGLNIIRKWVMSKMMKKSDDGIMVTLPDSKKVDLNTNITADRLLRNGVDIEQLTNTNQVDNLVNQINKSEMRVISQDDPRFKGIMDKIMGKKGEVFDMEGKKIKPGSKIMGGKAVDEDLPPPGSRGGPDDIAAPVQSAEEATTNLTDSTIQKIKKMEPIDAMKEANKVIKREGIYKALDKKQAKKILDDTEDHIFERDVDPEDFASGGRVGLKRGSSLKKILFEGLSPDGGIFQSLFANRKHPILSTLNATELLSLGEAIRPLLGFNDGGRVGLVRGGMTRRAFLKLLGAAGAGVGAAKTGILKLIGSDTGKKAAEEVIKTADVPGKPDWYDALVNRVIREGTDMTKQFATKEREIVHATKLDKDTYVRVTQDLDQGSVKVDYDNPDNMYGDPVQLEYKKPFPEEGNPNPSAEFTVAESGPVGRAFGPDDYEIEIDEITGDRIEDLTSDVSKLKEYATGKKQTLKEFVQSKKRKDRAKSISEGGENEMDEVVRRQGDYVQFDDVYPEQDFASGGIARMLGE